MNKIKSKKVLKYFNKRKQRIKTIKIKERNLIKYVK